MRVGISLTGWWGQRRWMQCAGLVETAGLWQEMSLLTLQLSSFAPELLHPLRLLSQRPLPALRALRMSGSLTCGCRCEGACGLHQ